MDLLEQIINLQTTLNTSIKMLRQTGQEYADAQRIYRQKLSEEILKLEAQGRPVTNLIYIARGTKEVANAKYNEICKEAIYKANLESINSIKLQLRILDNQYRMEYEND